MQVGLVVSPAMLVFNHFLSDVQQLLSGQVGTDLYLFVLVGPHALLESHVDFSLLDALGLGLRLHPLLVVLGEVLALDHLGLLLDEVGHEGRVLLQEGLLEKDGLVTQHQRHCALFGGLEEGVLDDDGVSLFELCPEEGLVAMDGAAAAGDGASAGFGLIVNYLVLHDHVLFCLLALLLRLPGLLGDVDGLGHPLLELQLSELQTAHALYFIREYNT